MPSESKRCAILRVTKTSGVFQVTVHTGAPAEKTTVFLLCMMIQRAADKWELLASSRTIFIGGRDMQFRDSALSWVNVLFQQYLNGELKDKVLVDYFNDLRRWSAAALLQVFDTEPGPLTPRQADEVDAHFQEAANRIFAEFIKIKDSEPGEFRNQTEKMH